MTSALHKPVSGDSRLFAIIGDPIAQARSPVIFNALFARAGFNGVMVPMQVPVDVLSQVIPALKSIGNLDGLVITVPHKVAMNAHVDRLGPSARRIGALNCARRERDGSWTGENFDGEGFVRGLHAQGHEPRGWRVHLVGAGGAGRAVAHALANAGVASLSIADVEAGRRDTLVDDLMSHHAKLRVESAGRDPGEVEIAINATPCGMGEDNSTPFDVDHLPVHAIVADLIMKPEVTALMRRATQRGLRTQAGRHMLENQAQLVAEFFGIDHRADLDI